MARAALAAAKGLDKPDGDKKFLTAKIGTARFYADYILTRAPAYAEACVHGSRGVLALDEDAF